MVNRRPIIGVMDSSVDEYQARAKQVGQWVACQGFHLLTGGGDGVMGSVTKAFAEVPGRAGLAIGIIPCADDDPTCRPEPNHPNSWIELPIYTRLSRGGERGDEPLSRNHINVLTSTIVILLPGGEGTASEARLALRYGKPCVAYLQSRDEAPSLPDAISVESQFSMVASFIRARTHSVP